MADEQPTESAPEEEVSTPETEQIASDDSAAGLGDADSGEGGSPESATLEAEQPSQPEWHEHLSGFGIEATDEIESPEIALAQAAERFAAVQQDLARQSDNVTQLSQLAQLGNEFLRLQQNPQYQQAISTIGQPAAPAEEAKPPGWWNPPVAAPDLRQVQQWLAVNPETGRQEWKPDAPAQLRSDFEAFKSYTDDWVDRLTTRPHEVMPEIIREYAQPLIQQELQDYLRKNSAQSFAEQIHQENADWMYQLDSAGNVVIEPITRQPQPTPEGARVISYIQQLRQGGMTDEQQIWETARAMLHRDVLVAERQSGQAAQNTQAANRQTAAERKTQHLQNGASRSAAGATASPNRNGASDVPGVPRQPENSSKTLGEKILDGLLDGGFKREEIPRLFSQRVPLNT